MTQPINTTPSSSLTVSMMISEGVYRLVSAVEAVWRWVSR